MKKRKYQGHYCKICGRRKSNEKFSGSGYTAHICRDCAKLPKEKRDEMQIITRIYSLPFWLEKEQRTWLEKKRSDPRAEVREAAEAAYEDRFGWVEEQRRANDELETYLSDRELLEDEDTGTDEDTGDRVPTDRTPANSEFLTDKFPADSKFLTDRFPANKFPSDTFPTDLFPADFKTDNDILPFK